MKKVLLSNIHKYFIVDDEDFEKVSYYHWCLSGDNPGGISAKIKNKTIKLGRFILNYQDELEIDHKDRNIFNNKKDNLRLATRTQNSANRFNTNNTSGYKGVSYVVSRNNWLAQIRIKHQTINLGRFNSAIEAAKAYNKAALEHFGEFAYLNPILEGGE